MLVISRKVGESILIGDNIEICISSISEGSVKIGINAPKSVKIVRKELIKEVREQNIEAVQNNDRILENLLMESVKKEE